MSLTDNRGLHYKEFNNKDFSYRLIHLSSLSLPKDVHNVDRGFSVWGYYFFACSIQATVAPNRQQLSFVITQEFPFLRKLYFWCCLAIQLSVMLEDCAFTISRPWPTVDHEWTTINRAKTPHTISITVWKWSFDHPYISDGMMLAVKLWWYSTDWSCDGIILAVKLWWYNSGCDVVMV